MTNPTDTALSDNVGAAPIRYDGNYLCRGHRFVDTPFRPLKPRIATPLNLRKESQK